MKTLKLIVKVSLLCFLSFPQETQQIPTEEVALDICLSNGQKVTVNILTSDQTEDVLDVSAGVCLLIDKQLLNIKHLYKKKCG